MGIGMRRGSLLGTHEPKYMAITLDTHHRNGGFHTESGVAAREILLVQLPLGSTNESPLCSGPNVPGQGGTIYTINEDRGLKSL